MPQTPTSGNKVLSREMMTRMFLDQSQTWVCVFSSRSPGSFSPLFLPLQMNESYSCLSLCLLSVYFLFPCLSHASVDQTLIWSSFKSFHFAVKGIELIFSYDERDKISSHELRASRGRDYFFLLLLISRHGSWSDLVTRFFFVSWLAVLSLLPTLKCQPEELDETLRMLFVNWDTMSCSSLLLEQMTSLMSSSMLIRTWWVIA